MTFHTVPVWRPWAQTLRENGWQGIAQHLFEATAPLHLLGAQVLRAWGPLLFVPDDLQTLTCLLEDEQEQQAFLASLSGE